MPFLATNNNWNHNPDITYLINEYRLFRLPLTGKGKWLYLYTWPYMTILLWPRQILCWKWSRTGYPLILVINHPFISATSQFRVAPKWSYMTFWANVTFILWLIRQPCKSHFLLIFPNIRTMDLLISEAKNLAQWLLYNDRENNSSGRRVQGCLLRKSFYWTQPMDSLCLSKDSPFAV